MVVADLIREYPTVFPTPRDIYGYPSWDMLVSFIFNLSAESRWVQYAKHQEKTDKSEEEITEELNRGGRQLFAMLGVNL